MNECEAQMATVIGGHLQLDHPLALPDNSRVEIVVSSTARGEQAIKAWESLQARLAQRPVNAQGLHFTRDELHERR